MYEKYIKRILDIVLSLVALLVLSPLIFVIAILVRIKLGKPVIFKQKRPGKNERIFMIYKFRTMTDEKDETGNLLPDSERLTKFGKFLRNSSLDELPELINIIKGDMSIVGPRPQLIKDMIFMTDEQRKRHNIRPGLTGLAQVNGRNNISWEEKINFDIKYIENITLINDLKIILKTFKKVLKKEDVSTEGMETASDLCDYLLKNNKITEQEYKHKLEMLDKNIEELVSVIMPTYNCGKYIEESIQSVINQTYKNWELIIVDDCSKDNTEKIVSSYSRKDNRIKYIKFNENYGAAIARNTAIKQANGKYIAFLDSDDIWKNNKLEKQIKFMKDNNYYFTYTNYQLIEEDGRKKNKIVTGPKKIGKIGMYNYCWLGCLTVIYNKEKIGNIQIENLDKNNDYAMWLKIVNKEKCYLLNEELAYYRIRSFSISNQKRLKLIKYHYKLFRKGEKQNIVFSLFNTFRNLLFGTYKKLVYVRKFAEYILEKD